MVTLFLTLIHIYDYYFGDYYQIDEENGGDPDINNELFGAEQDDRRNKIVTTATVRPANPVAPKVSFFVRKETLLKYL